jgi:tetratricopeptide (TPR) repeat protein
MRRKAPGTLATLLLGAGVALAVAETQPLDTHYQAARVALAKGDTTNAERELKLDLQDNPLHAQSHFLLASLLGRAGEIDQAIVGYQQTAKLEPNNAVARYNLGTALLLRGVPVLAARQLEDALASPPMMSRPTTIWPRLTSWPCVVQPDYHRPRGTSGPASNTKFVREPREPACYGRLAHLQPR